MGLIDRTSSLRPGTRLFRNRWKGGGQCFNRDCHLVPLHRSCQKPLLGFRITLCIEHLRCQLQPLRTRRRTLSSSVGFVLRRNSYAVLKSHHRWWYHWMHKCILSDKTSIILSRHPLHNTTGGIHHCRWRVRESRRSARLMGVPGQPRSTQFQTSRRAREGTQWREALGIPQGQRRTDRRQGQRQERRKDKRHE